MLHADYLTATDSSVSCDMWVMSHVWFKQYLKFVCPGKNAVVTCKSASALGIAVLHAACKGNRKCILIISLNCKLKNKKNEEEKTKDKNDPANSGSAKGFVSSTSDVKKMFSSVLLVTF